MKKTLIYVFVIVILGFGSSSYADSFMRLSSMDQDGVVNRTSFFVKSGAKVQLRLNYKDTESQKEALALEQLMLDRGWKLTNPFSVSGDDRWSPSEPISKDRRSKPWKPSRPAWTAEDQKQAEAEKSRNWRPSEGYPMNSNIR